MAPEARSGTGRGWGVRGGVNSYTREQLHKVRRSVSTGGLTGLVRHVAAVVRFRYRVGGVRGVLGLGALGRGTGEMARDWDERARVNARYFVSADHWQTEEEFYRSGERILGERLLKGIELSPHAVTLEIGCGVGRLLQPMGRRVRRAIGVDVSPEMVRRAGGAVAAVPSVEVTLGDGRTLAGIADGSVDLCYSYVVFQHLPDIAILTSYLCEAFRVLVPGGLLRFQIHATPPGVASIERGGTLMGIRPSRASLAARLEDVGFTVLEIEGEAHEEFEDLWITAWRAPGPGEKSRAAVTYASPSDAARR